MSLKVFHIVFVTLSALLCFGFGSWNLPEHAITAVVSFACGLALIVYGFSFWKKIGAISAKKVLGLSGLLAFAQITKAYGCATCYGDPSSPQSQGIVMAVYFLGSLTAVVLASVGIFVIYLNRSSRRAALFETQT